MAGMAGSNADSEIMPRLRQAIFWAEYKLEERCVHELILGLLVLLHLSRESCLVLNTAYRREHRSSFCTVLCRCLYVETIVLDGAMPV
jgi:hypothetical protein